MSLPGHSTTAAAIRYQHVLIDRDTVIAQGLDRAHRRWKWHGRGT
jgi:hypothetical protein